LVAGGRGYRWALEPQAARGDLVEAVDNKSPCKIRLGGSISLRYGCEVFFPTTERDVHPTFWQELCVRLVRHAGNCFQFWKLPRKKFPFLEKVQQLLSMIHRLNEARLQMILQALRKKGVSQADLAAEVGKGRPWACKFLNGEISKISEADLHRIEDFLEINLSSMTALGAERSDLAANIAVMVDSDPTFAKLAASLQEALHEARGAFTPRYVPTEEMASLGKRIIAIVMANQEKPGKVAREVLRLLA
jgi:transcriptional regulator with XRE-family HTH domain